MSLVMDQTTLLCNMFSVQSFVFLAVVSNLTLFLIVAYISYII